MADSASAHHSGALQGRLGLRAVERTQAVWAIATLLAWTHTVDEMRVGEFVAVPFGVLNAVLVATWPRMGRRGQAALAIGFGLFWGLAVIPYHVAPLLGGAVTWQNVSGLTRLAAGLTMVMLGAGVALRRGDTAAQD